MKDKSKDVAGTYDIVLRAGDIPPALLEKLEEIAQKQNRTVDKVIISLVSRLLGFPA